MGNAVDVSWSTAGPGPSSPTVAVDLSVQPVLSAALAQLGVPVVRELRLTTDVAVRGAVLRLSVQDADGPLGTAVEQTLDLEPGEPTLLTDAGPALDPAALRERARRPGWVRIELEAEGRLLVQHRSPVLVLAPGEWAATPLPPALELLAAHVRPDDPAVTALLADAAALLEEGTGDGDLTGYSEDPDRVDEVVEALAWAMRRRGLRAEDPAAGWAEAPVTVRTPTEVLDGRDGTSLDTVVTLAAACERAGIRPLLWLVDGHAFLGYWREERSADTVATTDVAALVDLVDLGLVRLVETTLLTDRGNPRHDLHGPAYQAWLSGDLGAVLGVTDVHLARRDGVRPLPATPDGAPDGTAVPAVAEPLLPADDEGAPSPLAREASWLRDAARLLDLSDGLPLTVPQEALAVLEDLVGSGATITLLPADRVPGVQREGGTRQAADLPAAQLAELLAEQRAVHVGVPESGYRDRLRGLATEARRGVERTGANDLHLALGRLVWELDGRPVRSPLLLVPVLLTPARDGSWRLTLDEAGAAAPNGELLAELRRRTGLTVPALTAAAGDADPAVGPGLDVALQAVRTALAGRRLPWRVEPSAELAVLPVSATRRAEDLLRHGTELAEAPLLAHLLADPAAPFADPVPAPAATVDLDELAARCPLPADASQLRAIADGIAGRTFVLEGAPGTGKSQTIANLLVRAAAEGKRALFVAAGPTALDAVARRLDAVGMGPFTLDLHDKGARPAVVRAQVRAALEHTVDVDAPGLAADAAELQAARRGLERYAERLHAANPAGLSYWSAHTAVLAAGDDVPALPVTAEFAASADEESVTAVHRALALLPDIADLARPSAGHAWGFLDTVELDITAVQQAAAAVDAAIRELPGEGGLAAAVRAARTPEDLDTLVHLLTGPRIGLDVLDEVRTPRWAAATEDLTAEVAALTGAVHPGLDVVTPQALDLPLAELSARAEAGVATGFLARRGTLGGLRDQLAPVLRPGASVKAKDVPALLAALGRVQGAVHAIAAGAATVPGLQVPAGWNPFLDTGRYVLDAEVRWLRRAAAAVDGPAGFAGALRRFLSAGPVADPAGARTVARLRDAVGHLLQVCTSDSAQLAAWCGEHGLVLHWTMTRPERGVEYVHPMSLRRWVSLLDTLEPLRHAGLTEARARLRNGLVVADDAVRAFDRGLAEATLAERAAVTGLDAFDAGLHERTLARFAAASRAVRSHLTAAVPAGMLAARRELDRSGEGPRAALQRELDEQRRGLGVLGLLAGHGELVTSLLPCVLAGPDAVARFLPATAGLFDLVVFDEASQLRLADAAGALGRARAAVVVGDSRQLPPAGATDPDPDTDTSGDQPSLLAACLRAGLPRLTLAWHYRSQDERLFAFSNAAYYDSRIATFPAPPTRDRAISLVPTGGTFLRSAAGWGTNPVEAAAVVAEVLRRFAAAAVPSLGVVTLHAAQRELIETLLRDSGDERVLEALDRTDGPGLLVGHVDDVQGEERDVVLLSPAASSGRLDLGALDRPGGERRLNVAVTRARREVVVLASFAPEELPVEESAPLGVRQLRSWLESALAPDAEPDRPAPRDRHRDEVAAALAGRGLVVRTDVGLSGFRIDVTVATAAAPETPLVAVLLDGPAWARLATVGDRDGLPAEVLGELRGWPAVERVWLPAWLADRDAVLDGLVAAVTAAAVAQAEPVEVAPEPAPQLEPEYDGPLADVIPLRPVPSAPLLDEAADEPAAAESVDAPPAPAPPAPAEPSAEPAPAEPSAAEPAPAEPAVAEPAASSRPARKRGTAPTAERLTGELRFAAWSPRPAGDKKQLDQLSDPAVAKVVRRVLAGGLKAEGPVHRDRLVRLAAGAFGLTRVTDARRDALLALLPRTTAAHGEFLWPAGLHRETWTGFRRQTTTAERPLEQVAPEEIGNAMAALTADADLTREELFARTVEVFGARRRTAAHLPALEAALAAAVARGRLTEQPDGRVTG